MQNSRHDSRVAMKCSSRLLLIMSFLEKPGMIGSERRTRELYGRITQAHLTFERERVRADRLMD
jgi:hypothetical protein